MAPPIAERLARALEVFSRARAAKERRLRLEIEPMTEPEKPVAFGLVEGVVVTVEGATEGVAAVEEARGGRDEAEEDVWGRWSTGEV